MTWNITSNLGGEHVVQNDVPLANIPDFMPVLRHGVGERPKDGGCLMQCASFIAYGTWEDRPECVHDFLNDLGIKVNDSVSDVARRKLALVIPELLNSDEAFTEWVRAHEAKYQADAQRRFWMDRSTYARDVFASLGVRGCSTCLANVGEGPAPQHAARAYVRCLIDNAEGVLWNDQAYDRQVVEEEFGGTWVEDEDQGKLVDAYCAIVGEFNRAVNNSPAVVEPDQWTALREAMTPASV